MERGETLFNHIGICVTDPQRSRDFYENALGFAFWWELDAPEEGSVELLQLDKPLDLHATYLVRDGLVLELLSYNPDRLEPWRKRSMAEPGLTHISITVGDMDTALARVEQFGGSVMPETNTGPAAMIRDPDGQLIELLTADWLDWPRPPRPT